MNFFTLFFLIVSLSSYGADPLLYSSQTDYDPDENRSLKPETLTTKELISQLKDQIDSYVNSLVAVLLSENTPRINKEEIVTEIQTIAEVKGKIARALIQISQSNIEQEGLEERDEDLSLWVKAQAELIRKKQSEADKLLQEVRVLTEGFYVDLAFNGVLIFAGGALVFIPAGQGVSFALIGGRLPLTAKNLRGILAGLGVLEGAVDVSYFLDEQEQRVASFVSNLVISKPFARELLTLLSSPDENERYLAGNLFATTTEENLITEILKALEKDLYSIKTKTAMIKTLRVFPNMESSLKKEVISFLKEIINDTENQLSLRGTALNVLGFLGEDMPEVTEYLRGNGSV